MSRTARLRQVTVALTVAVFAALLLAAGSTGHAPGHHGRSTTIGPSVATSHSAATASAPATDDHGGGMHLDHAVVPVLAGPHATTGRIAAPSAADISVPVRPATTTDSRGPPTA